MHKDGSRMVNTKEFAIIRRPKLGLKIGVIGLGEYGWVASVNCLDVDEVLYEDYLDCGKRLSHILSKLPFKTKKERHTGAISSLLLPT